MGVLVASSSCTPLALHPPRAVGGGIVRRAGVLAAALGVAALGIVATGAVSVAAVRHDATAGTARRVAVASSASEQAVAAPPAQDEIEWP